MKHTNNNSTVARERVRKRVYLTTGPYDRSTFFCPGDLKAAIVKTKGRVHEDRCKSP